MKLTMARSEGTRGLIFKKPEYYLDVEIELNSKELELMSKHNWGQLPVGTYTFSGGELALTVGHLTCNYDKKTSKSKNKWHFTSVGELQTAETGIIAALKVLKESLGAVVDFTTGEAREIEL